MDNASLLAGRTAILATQHRKEQVIRPLLEADLHIRVAVPDRFDTDVFGTFTRDVERVGTQLEAARLKARAALEMTGYSLGLASEGAFGPHPAMPWVACDRELVILIDRDQSLEIVGEALSAHTNYRQETVTSVAAALEFAAQVGFPDHGLVVMPAASGSPADQIHKGITEADQLEDLVRYTLTHHGSAWLETDMRALYNPSRMAVIREATQNLVQKARQLCPQCGWPGFDVIQRIPGLPCDLCGLPTPLTRYQVYGCRRCGYEQRVAPVGQATADPGQCAYCNP